MIGAIKEAVRSPHHSIRMTAPCPRLNVKQNADRRQGSAVVGTFKEDVMKISARYWCLWVLYYKLIEIK